MDFLLNEESSFCILHESFKNYHIGLLEDPEPSEEEVRNAEAVLKRANKSSNHLSTDIKPLASDVPTNSQNSLLEIKW